MYRDILRERVNEYLRFIHLVIDTITIGQRLLLDIRVLHREYAEKCAELNQLGKYLENYANYHLSRLNGVKDVVLTKDVDFIKKMPVKSTLNSTKKWESEAKIKLSRYKKGISELLDLIIMKYKTFSVEQMKRMLIAFEDVSSTISLIEKPSVCHANYMKLITYLMASTSKDLWDIAIELKRLNEEILVYEIDGMEIGDYMGMDSINPSKLGVTTVCYENALILMLYNEILKDLNKRKRLDKSVRQIIRKTLSTNNCSIEMSNKLLKIKTARQLLLSIGPGMIEKILNYNMESCDKYWPLVESDQGALDLLQIGDMRMLSINARTKLRMIGKQLDYEYYYPNTILLAHILYESIKEYIK